MRILEGTRSFFSVWRWARAGLAKNCGMALTALALMLAALAVSRPACAAESAFVGHVNFFVGEKFLEHDDWDPVDNQAEFGAETTWGRTSWPISIAGDLFLSGDKDDVGAFDLTGSTIEACFGARKIWDIDQFHPYVGGGLAAITGYAKVEGPFGIDDDDSDSNVGFWVGGGLFWRLGSHFNLGFAVRYSQAKVDLFGTEVEAGGTHAGILLGFGWPAHR